MVTFSRLASPNNYSRAVSRSVENTKSSKTSRWMNPRRVSLFPVLHDIFSTHQASKSLLEVLLDFVLLMQWETNDTEKQKLHSHSGL